MKKITRLDFIIYFGFICWFIINFTITTISIKNVNLLVSFTFFSIGIISIIGFIIDNNFLSFNKFIFIFSFLFLYLAPYYQYANDIVFWNLGSFSEHEYLYANILIIIFLLLYLFAYNIFFQKVPIFVIEKKENDSINDFTLIIWAILSIASVVFLFFNGELIKFDKTSTDEIDSIFTMILKIFRLFPALSLITYIFYRRKNLIKAKKKTKAFFLSTIIVCFAIIFFPLNATIGRYLLFGTYIMVFAAIFPNIKYKSLLLILAFVGFGIIFPLFNFFKYHSIMELNKLEFDFIDLGFQDYDAYQILMSTVRMVSKEGPSYGLNILTSIFCLVPRSIWHTKGYPSGEIVATFSNASFTNVSCPLIAEFYLSFGVIGLFIFTILFSLFIRIIDKGSKGNKIEYKVLNCILIGLALALLRGALLPVSTFIWSVIISFIILLFFKKICRIIEVSL